MKWDGSHLGAFSADIITSMSIITPRCFWVSIEIDEKEYECVLQRDGVKKDYFCVVDEMKPVFGLKKLGTHTIVLDHSFIGDTMSKRKTRYILIREDIRDLPNVTISLETIPRSAKNWRVNLQREIDLHLIFRKLMLIRYTSIKDIFVKEYNGEYKTVSYDHFSNTIESPNVWSMKFLHTIEENYWNSYKGQDEVIKRLLEDKTVDEIENELMAIVKRLNEAYVKIVEVVVEHLSYI